MTILNTWHQVTRNAEKSAIGVSVQFKSSMQAEPTHIGLNFQQAVFIGLVIDPEEYSDFDEVSLPMYKIRFGSGLELAVIEEEMYCSCNRLPDVLALCAAVNLGFATARKLGFDGPFDLDAHASVSERAAFTSAIDSYHPGWAPAPSRLVHSKF